MTPMTRSEIMSRIRSKGTKPELAVQRAASALHIRHTRNDGSLPGTPDLFIPMDPRRGPLGAAVFVDGCFWHGHACHYREPKTNVAFWRGKIAGNRRRDRRVFAAVRRSGFIPVRIKECEIRRVGASMALRRAMGRASKWP